MTGFYDLHCDGTLIETVTIDGHIGFFLSGYFTGATVEYTAYKDGTVIGQFFYPKGEPKVFSLYRNTGMFFCATGPTTEKAMT